MRYHDMFKYIVTHRWQGDLPYKRVRYVQERRHSCNICRPLHRQTRDQWFLSDYVAKWMVLHAGENHREQDSDAHGHRAEHAEAAQLRQRTRKADEEAEYRRDEAPYYGACSIAICQCV